MKISIFHRDEITVSYFGRKWTPSPETGAMTRSAETTKRKIKESHLRPLKRAQVALDLFKLLFVVLRFPF
jgi:hypothetical protein